MKVTMKVLDGKLSTTDKQTIRTMLEKQFNTAQVGETNFKVKQIDTETYEVSKNGRKTAIIDVKTILFKYRWYFQVIYSGRVLWNSTEYVEATSDKDAYVELKRRLNAMFPQRFVRILISKKPIE